MTFLTYQSWCVLKSKYTGGGPEQGCRRYFADGLLTGSLVPFVAQQAKSKAKCKDLPQYKHPPNENLPGRPEGLFSEFYTNRKCSETPCMLDVGLIKQISVLFS